MNMASGSIGLDCEVIKNDAGLVCCIPVHGQALKPKINRVQRHHTNTGRARDGAVPATNISRGGDDIVGVFKIQPGLMFRERVGGNIATVVGGGHVFKKNGTRIGNLGT